MLTGSLRAALLVYRVFRNEPKRSTKALHALLHGLALLIALVGACCGPGWVHRDGSGPGGNGLLSAGIIAVFESHRAKGIPNMYSLHSWCGMAAFVLYLLQVSAGDTLSTLPAPHIAPCNIPVPHSGSWAVVSSCSPVPPSRCVAATSPSTSSSASPSLPSPSPPACWASPRCCSSTSGW